ncbi:CCHC-type domain-containing protein [Camponotus japonicus]
MRETRALATEIPGISSVSLKRAQTGGILLQFPGGEGHRLADEIAAKMRRVAAEKRGVRVARPMKRAELRLHGLDDSVTKEEVIGSVAGLMGCRAEDLAVGEIRSLPNRLVWLRCPVAVSNKLLEEGRWRIGWATMTAKPLLARWMRCFRCLEMGHGAAGCQGPDRSGRCHRCGDRSHQSRQCSAGRSRYPLCAEFGLSAEHLQGAAACVPSRRVAQRRLAAKAREKSRGTKPQEGDETPMDSGRGSKGGPRRAKPLPQQGPRGRRGGPVRKREKVPPPRPWRRAPPTAGGDCSGRLSLKRTVSERSPSAQREKESGGSAAGQMLQPVAPAKKKRDRKGRFSTC